MEKEMEIGKQNMARVLQNFQVNTLIDSTLIHVTNSNLVTIILRYQNSFTQLFKDFTDSIGKQFENFPTLFKQKTNAFVITGFDKTSSTRNLNEEYYLVDIELVLIELEKDYKTFSDKILNSKNYANIANIQSALNTGLSNDALTLTKNFYPYKILIQQYTDDSIIDNYFTQLENEAENISKRTMDYISNTITQIQQTLDVIYEGRLNSWPTIRTEINKVVYDTLDEVFKEKFKNLEKIESSSLTQVKNNLIVEPLNIPGEEEEATLNKITFNISNINYKFGYSLKKDGDYNFKMNVFTEGDITLDIIQSVGNRVIEKISGKLGSGKIGLNANYTLHNLGVDYEAYANIDEVEFSQIATTYVDENRHIFYSASREFDEKEIYMKKKLRSLYFEP